MAESPARPSAIRRWSPLWTALLALIPIAFALGITGSGGSTTWSDRDAHFWSHALVGLPLLLLAVAALTLWPRPPGRLGQVARRVITSGLFIGGLGAMVEATGAYGWAAYGDVQINDALATVHDLGALIGPVAGLVLLVGLVVAGVNRLWLLRSRRRPTNG
jgi:hypothetical protein